MKKILVINLMYLGDLLFMTPLLRTLRSNYPAAKIDLLVDQNNQSVVLYNPYISELIAIDKKGYHNKLPNYLRLLFSIRKECYDLVINLHPNERASAIAAFCGAKQIVGLSAKGFGRFFSELVHKRRDIHQVDAYLEIGKILGLRMDNHGLEMQVDRISKQNAEKLWAEAGLWNTKVIGLNTGGSWPTKRWTTDGFAKLAEMLQQDGYQVVFFGGPMDKSMVDEIVGRMKKKPVIFTGRVNLLELAALIKKCTVFVSGDSGPMHIATSQGVPVVAIFGPSDPVRYAPYHISHCIIKADVECLACGEHKCEHHSCMKNVTPAQVFLAVKEIIVKSSYGNRTNE